MATATNKVTKQASKSATAQGSKGRWKHREGSANYKFEHPALSACCGMIKVATNRNRISIAKGFLWDRARFCWVEQGKVHDCMQAQNKEAFDQLRLSVEEHVNSLALTACSEASLPL